MKGVISVVYPDLSSKQEQILKYIINMQKSTGFPPTVREICKAVGLNSSSTVHSHLKYLERKGYIMRIKGKPRAIKVLDKILFIFSVIMA